MAEKKTEQTSAPKKGGTLKLIVIVMVLALLGAGGAYYFFVYKPQHEAAPPKEETKAAALVKPVTEEGKIGPIVELKEFIANIITTDTQHFVKASFSLELDKAATTDEVNMRMPQIRDAILLILSNKTFEEVQDVQGKNQVKAEVKSKINSFLKTGKVVNVYLTDFVVQ
ncbi:MAG: flagellar basal body-associated FliL family protein [Proteobacteria bacterium]|nr:flagellar basal body-associated FliL family protein [Pseudomonadota bacterium]